MLRSRKYLAFSIGLLSLLGVAYIGYLRVIHAIECPTEKRTMPLSVPQYPEMTRMITTTAEIYHDGERGELVFITTDTPETVLTFYTTSLRTQGWRDVRRGRDARGYQFVGFRETQRLPVYFLTIYTNTAQDGTRVEVISGSDRNPCLRR